MAYIFAYVIFLFVRLDKKIRCQKGSWGLFLYKKAKKNADFWYKICICRKKAVLLHAKLRVT